jgi:hypothetical protein
LRPKTRRSSKKYAAFTKPASRFWSVQLLWNIRNIIDNLLKKPRIPHYVLNAKQHQSEALIVAQAGRRGSVTISTNMAGRGTDILLGGNAEGLASERWKKSCLTGHC